MLELLFTAADALIESIDVPDFNVTHDVTHDFFDGHGLSTGTLPTGTLLTGDTVDWSRVDWVPADWVPAETTILHSENINPPPEETIPLQAEETISLQGWVRLTLAVMAVCGPQAASLLLVTALDDEAAARLMAFKPPGL